jgi:hypothetical protein
MNANEEKDFRITPRAAKRRDRRVPTRRPELQIKTAPNREFSNVCGQQQPFSTGKTASGNVIHSFDDGGMAVPLVGVFACFARS